MVFSSILFLFSLFAPDAGHLLHNPPPVAEPGPAGSQPNLLWLGRAIYVLIMIFSILVDYSHGLLIARHRENDRFCRKVVASSVIINLGLLVFFKYYDLSSPISGPFSPP